MDIFQLFTLFKKQIEEKEQSIIDALVGGSCKSMEEYKYLTGKLEALRSTKAEMQETMKRFDNE